MVVLVYDIIGAVVAVFGVVAVVVGGDNVGVIDGLDVGNVGAGIRSVAALVSAALPVFCAVYVYYIKYRIVLIECM